ERFALAHAALDLSHEQDHGGGVLAGDMHACQGIGGTRAARDHADARFASEFPVSVRHHGRATFLTADRHFDVVVVQTVQHGQIAFTGNTEHVTHAVRYELVHQDVSAHAGCGRRI